MPLRVWRIGLTVVTCDGCGRVERRRDRPSGYHALLREGWREFAASEHPVGELLCPECVDSEPARST